MRRPPEANSKQTLDNIMNLKGNAALTEPIPTRIPLAWKLLVSVYFPGITWAKSAKLAACAESERGGGWMLLLPSYLFCY